MRRAVIIHCWEGYPKYRWYPAAKAALGQAGIATVVPARPDSEHPNQKRWVDSLTKAAGDGE